MAIPIPSFPLLLCGGLCLLLASCAGAGARSAVPTAYQKGTREGHGLFGFGYVDACTALEAVPDTGSCDLAYQANAATDDDRLFHYLIFRAAEVGRDHGYPYFRFQPPEFSWLRYKGKTHGRLASMQVQYLRDIQALGSRRDWSGTVYDVRAIYNGMKDDPSQSMPPSGIAEAR